VSDRTAELPLLIVSLAFAWMFTAAPSVTQAQAPPPPPVPPPAGDTDDTGDSDNPPEPETPETRESDGGDPPEQAETLGEDGLPAPPMPEEVEEGGDTTPDADQSAPPEKDTPSKTYDAQFLHITKTQGDPIAHQFRYGTGMIAVRGTFGSIVDPPDFYQKVGRPELAERYERRSTARMVFLGSSVLVGSVGSYVFAVAGAAAEPFCFTTCTPQQQRQQRTANVLYGLSAASFLGGLAGFLGSLFWSAHPVDIDQRQALADAYNDSLKRELGLPSDHSAHRTVRPVQLRVGGAPTDGGAMGILTLEF
jgi:hypothetical protein